VRTTPGRTRELQPTNSSSDFDVIIAGLGAMGSAAAFHLARAGKRVLGLDRFHPPHSFGSSHGLTRIIREAYFEHPLYVPLVQRSYELWGELERETGERLFLPTGGLMIGPPNGVLFSGAKRSAEQHNLRHEVLSSGELRGEYPMLDPGAEMAAVREPRAGILFPELAIKAHLESAVKQGAILRFEDPVIRWEPEGDRVRVFTSTGSWVSRRLLLSVGAWLSSLTQDLNLPLSVERQVLFWFQPRDMPGQFSPERFPIQIWQYGAQEFFYCMPDLGDGVKFALHHQGEKIDPDNLHQQVGEVETVEVRKLLRRFIPAADGPLKSAQVCMYTNTPDEHFILDCHPKCSAVLIASPCSGHGFKFSAAVGELAAALLTQQTPGFDLSLFKLSRFAGGETG
jgi:sarcosine oxidase